ncbi:MAG: hypothetical protein ACI9NY_000833 [Kiritimatiellia bacterium]|jgi:hypothetical protein
MNKPTEDELNSRVKQDLDDSVRALDASTLSKLHQIRSQAVDQAERKKNRWLPMMVGSLITAGMMIFSVAIIFNTSVTELGQGDDFELVSISDNLELLEDLEFYEWLEDDALSG